MSMSTELVTRRTCVSKVRQLINPQTRETTAPSGISAQILNNHYAAMMPSQQTHLTNHQKPRIPVAITRHWWSTSLSHLGSSSTNGNRTWWFTCMVCTPRCPGFRRTHSPTIQPITHHIHCSTVPQQWKQAIISPIPKVPHPALPSQFRPISITSVLSRVMEKHIVKTYIYPSLVQPPIDLNVHDQCAFRPTGSTTAALIALLQTISDMLISQP